MIANILTVSAATVDTSKIGISAGDEWEIEVKECTIQSDCEAMGGLSQGDYYIYRVITNPDSEGVYNVEIEPPSGEIIERQSNLNWIMSEAIYYDWTYWSDNAHEILNGWFMSSGDTSEGIGDGNSYEFEYTVSEENIPRIGDPTKTAYLHINLNLEYDQSTGIRNYLRLEINSSDPFYYNGILEFDTVEAAEGDDGFLPAYEVPLIILTLLVLIPIRRKIQDI